MYIIVLCFDIQKYKNFYISQNYLQKTVIYNVHVQEILKNMNIFMGSIGWQTQFYKNYFIPIHKDCFYFINNGELHT